MPTCTYVYAAAEQVALALTGYAVIVTKSTVPVGTGRRIQDIVRSARPDLEFDVASNPEFLREGNAIGDFMRPDRVVIGAESDRAREAMRRLYRPLYLIEAPIVFTAIETAELTKYAANAFLAMKVTFINEMADLCEKVGADVHDVARGIGLDGRIGRKFLHPGPGYGGSCFPKDTLALVRTAQDYGAPSRLVEATVAVNDARKSSMAMRVIAACGGSVRNKTIAVLGLTFKPETDDMRDAPSLSIVARLAGDGAIIRAFDPEGMDQARPLLPRQGAILCGRPRCGGRGRRSGPDHRMERIPGAGANPVAGHDARPGDCRSAQRLRSERHAGCRFRIPWHRTVRRLMPDPTRKSAYDLLAAVLEKHRTLEDALDALPPQDARDRAAAHRLGAAVLRRMGTLDAVLEPFLRKEPPEPVRNILRIGAAGLLLLETPSHAAVGTAVQLAKRRGLAPFSGLINAVLRKVATEGPAALDDLDTARLDTPAWLWTAWGQSARAIATAHQTEAPLDVTLKPGITPPEGGERLPTGSVRFPPGTRVSDIPGFDTGNLWVQDAAAALPAQLLAAQPNERIADLCAAPGGKTAQLAAAGGLITAIERDPARIERLTSNLKQWNFHADVINADATEWRPPQLFDAVLLDAPCSATGTIRRHPDVARLKRPRDVQTVILTQDKLLAAAIAMLRTGGRLIYAVCSLQPEEGAPRIATALANGAVRHDPFRPDELQALPEALTREGFLRTHPGLWRNRGGMDGFFAARLIKT